VPSIIVTSIGEERRSTIFYNIHLYYKNRSITIIIMPAANTKRYVCVMPL
jgi:hypothetical protein